MEVGGFHALWSCTSRIRDSPASPPAHHDRDPIVTLGIVHENNYQVMTVAVPGVCAHRTPGRAELRLRVGPEVEKRDSSAGWTGRILAKRLVHKTAIGGEEAQLVELDRQAPKPGGHAAETGDLRRLRACGCDVGFGHLALVVTEELCRRLRPW